MSHINPDAPGLAPGATPAQQSQGVSIGLTSEEAARRLAQYGRNELEEKEVSKLYLYASQFWQPMPIMIWIAIIIEGVVGGYYDLAILLIIQFANGTLSFYEITKAGNAVKALKAQLKPEATVKRDGKFIAIDAALLVPGDLVILESGHTVPADCSVNSGQIDVDQAALTGESLPAKFFTGELAKMGSTVVRGSVEATVSFTGKDTFFGKTAALLQQDHERSNLQKMLIRVMVVLVVASLTLCIIVFIYLLTIGKTGVMTSLSFTVVLLVASIPIAIEIVCTTTLALGSKQLASHGAIVTRLAAIEDLAGISVLCSDKTGTLTMNKMVIQDNPSIYFPGETQYSLLRYAAMAAKWREPPRDALDTMVLGQADLNSLENVTQVDFMPFDPTVKRTEGTVRLPDGTVFKTTKGAPHVIVDLVEDHEIHERVHADVTKLGVTGTRCLAVAKTDSNGKWQMLGLLTFLDPERPDSKATIEQALENGVEVKMITGDSLLIAKEMARRLGLGARIQGPEGLPSLVDGKPPKGLVQNFGQAILMSDGFAQVFPEHKFLIVECLRQMGYKVGMTGDGVNDAPALKRADVGVAVEGATEAARAAADIVFTKPGLHTIVHGIILSRCIFERMKVFLTYRIAATLQLLVFFFIAVLTLKPKSFVPNPVPQDFPDSSWPDFFHLPVLMLMLITLLNDGTLISIGYDRVKPSRSPQVWNLRRIFLISATMATIICGESLLLLWFGLDSWNKNGAFHALGLGKVSYGQVTTMIYLNISVADFLTMFSSRSHGHPFFYSRPAPILMAAACLSLTVSTIISLTWMNSAPDNVPTIGMALRSPKLLALFVWGYSIIIWWVEDLVKLTVYTLVKKFKIFQARQILLPKVPLTPKTKAYRRRSVDGIPSPDGKVAEKKYSVEDMQL